MTKHAYELEGKVYQQIVHDLLAGMLDGVRQIKEAGWPPAGMHCENLQTNRPGVLSASECPFWPTAEDGLCDGCRALLQLGRLLECVDCRAATVDIAYGLARSTL